MRSGPTSEPYQRRRTVSRQSDLDNHANQLNPNNDAYWESRGWDERPDDWKEHASQDHEVSQTSRFDLEETKDADLGTTSGGSLVVSGPRPGFLPYTP